MEAKIICYFGHMCGQPLIRTFGVNDPELAKHQICYFDRFIPAFEECLKRLEESFKLATLREMFVIVSCHGYNHKYEYNNGKLKLEKKG